VVHQRDEGDEENRTGTHVSVGFHEGVEVGHCDKILSKLYGIVDFNVSR
jgi:hypothetical protein